MKLLILNAIYMTASAWDKNCGLRLELFRHLTMIFKIKIK